MPVLSYIVCPLAGRSTDLVTSVCSLPECELITSDDDNVMILVTETRNDDHETELQAKLEEIDSVALLVMAFGHSASTEKRP